MLSVCFPLRHSTEQESQSLRNTSTKECNHIELSTSKPQCRPPLLCISRFTARLVHAQGQLVSGSAPCAPGQLWDKQQSSGMSKRQVHLSSRGFARQLAAATR